MIGALASAFAQTSPADRRPGSCSACRWAPRRSSRPMYIAEQTPPKIRGGTVTLQPDDGHAGHPGGLPRRLRALGTWSTTGAGCSASRWCRARRWRSACCSCRTAPGGWSSRDGSTRPARCWSAPGPRTHDIEQELEDIEEVTRARRAAGGSGTCSAPGVRPLMIIGHRAGGRPAVRRRQHGDLLRDHDPASTPACPRTPRSLWRSSSASRTSSFTIVAVLLLDRVGRRALLINGTISLTIALFLLGSSSASRRSGRAPRGSAWSALTCSIIAASRSGSARCSG